MFHQGTSRPGLSAHDVSEHDVSARARSASALPISAPALAVLIVGAALLLSPRTMQAQHGGGGGGGRGMLGTGVGVGTGRPDGISEKDELKDFHRAMAVQATAEQRAAFAKVAQYAETAIDQLQTFRESLKKVSASSPLADRATTLDQAIENARGSNQNFLTSFSSQQKSGLEDITKKLEKADSELDKEIKALDQIVRTLKPETEQISEPISISAASLGKALTNFQNEQLTLGREMSILFDPAGQGVTFSLPAVTNAISIDGQPISIPASGAVSRTSLATSAATSAATPAENNQNLFSLKVVDDLTDVQQNVTAILRSGLNRSPRCGERIEILEATLTPLEPASLVVARLHFERWVCLGGSGATEVADGEATLEVKLTPALEPTTGLHLIPEITRVEAEGLLRDSLRSGDLGITLRDQIGTSILSVLQQGTNLKSMLPPAAQPSATLQKAQFKDEGADQLSLLLDGQLKFTDEQTQQFAQQLKQRLSAKQTTP